MDVCRAVLGNMPRVPNKSFLMVGHCPFSIFIKCAFFVDQLLHSIGATKVPSVVSVSFEKFFFIFLSLSTTSSRLSCPIPVLLCLLFQWSTHFRNQVVVRSQCFQF